MDKSRHSGTAPEVLPVDSTLQPYMDYSGPQAIFDKSQKQVALGEARLAMALGKGKEAYGIEGLEIVSVMIITVIVQAASSGGQEKLLNIHKTKGDGTAHLAKNVTVSG